MFATRNSPFSFTTYGVPRDGAALLHGVVYCGACGHKMVVQYKNGSRYICNYLRQQHGVPVCQYIQTNPVDTEAVAAFFKALAPAELDAFAQAMAVRRAADEAALKAQAQQVERLRYRATLAERQFDQVDPDNRLVAAELERRWEETLRDLRKAEASLAAAGQDTGRVVPFGVGPDLRAAFAEVGRRLPDLWQEPALTTARKKALLRCLIDKVVIHRAARDTIAMRIVWRGGATSAATVPVTAGSLADLSRSREREADIVTRARAGESDQAIAAALTAAGHRSPQRDTVLRSTVQAIRLRHGILHKPSQSHQRRIPGCLTVSQLTARLGVTPHTGSTTASITARLPSPPMPRPGYTCSRMCPGHSARSESSKPASWNASPSIRGRLVEEGTNMQSRRTTGCRRPRCGSPWCW